MSAADSFKQETGAPVWRCAPGPNALTSATTYITLADNSLADQYGLAENHNRP